MHHFSALLLPALSALVLAAPAPVSPVPAVAGTPDGMQVLSDYFNLLASKTQALRYASEPPVCDITKASLPQLSKSLPLPDTGLRIKHIAIGRGTQNYTCSSPTSKPESKGAVATLFDASCLAATHPDIFTLLPPLALQFSVDAKTTDVSERAHHKLGPADLRVSGVHYFTPGGSPFFDLDFAGVKLGHIVAAKNASVDAVDASDVPWLKLVAKESTGGLKEVYRVGTQGGNPPLSCEGVNGDFTVDYAAEYWFYGDA